MKIVLIHGQNHNGSTCHIARMLAKNLQGEVKEFFLPRDFDEFCIGCTQCFMKDEKLCPHVEKLGPITEAMKQADVLILASPTYVYHVTGAMKSWLDHYGYQWMVHRPEESMFSKQAVCISTAAGGGMKSANKDMKDSLSYWGVPKIYQYGMAVHATNYNGISDKKKKQIQKDMSMLVRLIKRRAGHIKPGIKTRIFFAVMGKVQKKGWNEADSKYWKEKGWTNKKRPWKK
ncbi:MAG: flavodoxin family protein [Anaerostipes sp.]